LNKDKYSVSQIKDKIRKLYKSIEGIQEECSHDIVIRYSEERKSVMRICKNCEKIIGYPSREELIKNGYTK